MHSGEQYKLHLSVCPVGKHRGPLNSLLLTSVCPSALILQNKNVTKLSHQNIVPKSQGSRLIRNHLQLYPVIHFLRFWYKVSLFALFVLTFTWKELGSISLLSLDLSSLSNCPHVSSIYSSTMVDNHDGLNVREKCVTVI